MDQTTQAIKTLILVLVAIAIVCFVLAASDSPRNGN